MRELKILSFILIFLFTIPLFAQDNETYDVLEVISKNRKYKLNRSIVIDQNVKNDIIDRIEYDNLLESIRDGLLPREDVENFISKDDVIELREKINLNNSPCKWDRTQLKKKRY